MNASTRTLMVLFILSGIATVAFSAYLLFRDPPRDSFSVPRTPPPKSKIAISKGHFLKVGQGVGIAFTMSDPRIVPPKEMQCLAKNIYHEARGEGIADMMGVAQITLNRADIQYRGKKTLCGVVNDPKQFSWTITPTNRTKKLNKASWQQSMYVAQLVLMGVRIQGLEDSLYFHSNKITPPKWSKSLSVNKRIGRHIYLGM